MLWVPAGHLQVLPSREKIGASWGHVPHQATEQKGWERLSHRPEIGDISSGRAEVRGMNACHWLWSSVRVLGDAATVSGCAKLSSIAAIPESF